MAEDDSSDTLTYRNITKVMDKVVVIEDFITEIEKFPVLWDKRLKAYTDKILKFTAWESVLDYFFPAFEEKNIREKNIFVAVAQKKWRNIRVCYNREVKKANQDKKCGSAAKARRQYVHFGLLRFLDTLYKKSSKSVKKSEDRSHSEYTSPEVNNILNMDIKCENSTDEYTQLSTTPIISHIFASNSCKTKHTSEEDEHGSTEQEESNSVFVKHIANKLRNINPNQMKFVTKLISDVLFEAEMESLNRNWTLVDTSKLK